MIKNYFARRVQLKEERALAREAALARKREEMAKTEEPEDLQEKEEDIDTEEKEKLDIETVPPVEDELFPRHEFDTTDPMNQKNWNWHDPEEDSRQNITSIYPWTRTPKIKMNTEKILPRSPMTISN